MEDNLFKFHKLNADGIKSAQYIQQDFENLVKGLQHLCGNSPREWAIVKTKLEEACFFAKKAMAIQKVNQDNG